MRLAVWKKWRRMINSTIQVMRHYILCVIAFSSRKRPPTCGATEEGAGRPESRSEFFWLEVSEGPSHRGSGRLRKQVSARGHNERRSLTEEIPREIDGGRGEATQELMIKKTNVEREETGHRGK